jgi:type I restriction enzyme S subunit
MKGTLNWKTLPFETAVKSRGAGSSGLPQNEWLVRGRYPVIGQGSANIEGWTDRDDLLVTPESGVVLYGGHTRRAKHVSQPFVPGPNVKILQPISAINSKFLYYFLTQLPVQSRGYADHFPLVRESEVPVPTFLEQERIVNLLDEADALRTLRAQADRRTAAFIPALFQEIFGDPVSNSHQYPTARLGDIATVERGRFSPRPRNDPSYFGGEYPFIQTGDIAESRGFLTRWKQTLNDRGRSVSKEFPVGTIVIAIVGATIGQTAILGLPVYATDSVVGIRPQPECVLVEYLIAVLQRWRPVFIAQAPETARANLNAATLKAVEIPIPPLPLQKEFAQRVSEIRELETAQAASRQRTEHLFQSMLHRAFNQEL